MTGKPAAFYVPRNLDLNLYPKDLRCSISFVLNTIHWKFCCKKADDKKFVRLCWRYLTKVVPSKILREIVHGFLPGFYRLPGDTEKRYPKVIETDGAEQGIRCRGYRLAPGYWDTHRIECKDDAVNRRIRRLNAKEETDLLPVHDWLRSNLDRLQFDMGRARSIIATMKPKRRGKRQPLTVAEYRSRITGRCQRLVNGDHSLIADKYGRVHTLFTSLPKKLRGCLSVDGKLLVGVDLANSQPLFLGLFARRYFASRSARHRCLNVRFGGKRDPYSHKAVRALASHRDEEHPADLREFVRISEQGRSYESMMTPEERAKGDKYRERFKVRFYRGVLFGKNSSVSRWPNELRRRFRQRFPSVAEVLRGLKRKNYRHSSHVLQNYEATLFIGIICKRIMQERPELPLFTVHDSLFTVPEHLEYVKGVIKEEFEKLGAHPLLKTQGDFDHDPARSRL